MEDFLFWLSLAANIITLLAGFIAVGGVVWAILGRGRLEIQSQMIGGSLSPVTIVSVLSLGPNPVRGVEFGFGQLDEYGYSMSGDGIIVSPALNRGETLSFTAYEAGEMTFGSDARDNEVRFEIQDGSGWYLTVRWQSPLFPWRTTSRTLALLPSQLIAGDVPRLLSGRRELALLRRTQDPALNPLVRSHVHDIKSHAVAATDRTFDDLLAPQGRPTLVVLGGAWQGKWWERLKRMLDEFARRNASSLTVLTVDINDNPAIADRFDSTQLPVFHVLRSGAVEKTYVGPHSFTDLAREMREYL